MIEPDKEIQTYQIDITSPYWRYKDGEVFDEEMAVAELLSAEKIVIGGLIEYENDKSIASLDVIANDVWMWGCSDSEPLPINEIKNLWLMYKENKIWGDVWWSCKQRNMQPQEPVRIVMIKNNAYPEWMNDLGKNYDQKESK
jgi:hypothetical protein